MEAAVESFQGIPNYHELKKNTDSTFIETLKQGLRAKMQQTLRTTNQMGCGHSFGAWVT
jgi:hypothetical protein